MVRRGDIFYADFDPRRGSEQGGRRPGLVVSNDRSNRSSSVVNLVPLTHTRPSRKFPQNVDLPPGVLDDRGGTILCGQIVTFSQQRLLRYYGRLPEYLMAQVDEALRIHFDL